MDGTLAQMNLKDYIYALAVPTDDGKAPVMCWAD